MSPTRCKHERDISAAMKRWEERCRILNVDDREVELSDSWKMTALKSFLCREIQKNVEHRQKEFKSCEELRSVVMKKAINKKIKNERAGFDMDCDLAGGHQQEDWWSGGWPTPEESTQPATDPDLAGKDVREARGKECSSEVKE